MKKLKLCAVLCAICCLAFLMSLFWEKQSGKSKDANNMNFQYVSPVKQWYLENDGTFVCDFINLEAWNGEIPQAVLGVDIGFEERPYDFKRKCRVAIIDTGIDVNDNFFSGIWLNEREVANNGIDDDANGFIDDISGWNFVDDNNELYVTNEFHGNCIASILCGNSKEYVGLLSEKNAEIMILKVLDGQDVEGKIEDLLLAIKYAEENGAQICNLSEVVLYDSPQLREAIETSNMLFVVAAGNYGCQIGNEYRVYPSLYLCENVITVADIRADGKLSETSNYGIDYVDVAAPGTDIGVMLYENKYTYMSGTSFSAPIVTAEAALIYSNCNKTLSAEEIKKIICLTVTKNEFLKNYVRSSGVVNFSAAMEYIEEMY